MPRWLAPGRSIVDGSSSVSGGASQLKPSWLGLSWAGAPALPAKIRCTSLNPERSAIRLIRHLSLMFISTQSGVCVFAPSCRRSWRRSVCCFPRNANQDCRLESAVWNQTAGCLAHQHHLRSQQMWMRPKRFMASCPPKKGTN